ncbi:MAG: isoprenyl transferase [bacterium]
MKSIKDSIDFNRLPQHIAVIMDGNGRWARQQGKERLFGHLHGVESVRAITEAATEIGIKYLTLYTFSTENWNRPKEEIDGLMDLLVENIAKETPTFHKNNIRLTAIGDNSMLPPRAQEKLRECINDTANNTGLTLILALSYSSRWEITNAAKIIAQKLKDGEIDIDQINDEMVSSSLTTNGIPDPDLLIRTSGELRLSNYLLWQLAYSELYFTEILWPDFRTEEFYAAIYEYQQRERRYGKTSEQL